MKNNNIRRWAKVRENTIKSLKMVYIRKNLKLGIQFLHVSEKPLDLIKNPLITIVVRNVRMGFLKRKNTWASRSTI